MTIGQETGWGRVVGGTAVVVLCGIWLMHTASAQDPQVHYLPPGGMPPGAIGGQQLLRGGMLPGFFQPVEIRAPHGTLVSLAESGTFGPAQPAPVRVGLLIGQVYRLCVVNIPTHEGLEVFPTVEVVNRLHTPRGQETRFPIIIDLTKEDLELALDGKFVNRVIYLEDPLGALPVRDDPQVQGWFDVKPSDDPLAVADRLGRVMAIVRIGGRVPDVRGLIDMDFLFGCPPFLKLPPAGTAPPSATSKQAPPFAPTRTTP